MAKIYILSGAVHSGKTTRLLNWANQRKDVYGVLAPIIEERRFLLNIHTKESRLLEAPPKALEEKLVHIGKYSFFKATFRWGRQVLEQTPAQKAAWLVIDEIGPLELAGLGLEPAVHAVLKNMPDSVNVMLVVREKLLNTVLEYYGLKMDSINMFDFDESGQ
ncbi:MAG TPA: hypothetical protein ENK44_14250 [Caldithrix abyssi]|uniref:NTPase n=1 Tax=Caldithrix abyssi TaxID=187145 RepID=A0A7V4U2J5_CALAY|nr:hypothetical protein [Caldithrix abyssi]